MNTNRIITALPKKKDRIDWINTVGMNVQILYKGKEYSIDIIGYKVLDNMPRLLVKYLDHEKDISIASFKECKFANLLGLYEYKYSIGDVIKCNSSNIKIIEKTKISQKCKNYVVDVKAYKYQCLQCKNIDVVREGDLNQKKGCNVCGNNKVLKDINSISKTHPHIASILQNQEEAEIYSSGSKNITKVKCPDCGYEHNCTISKLCSRGFNCKRCGDNISFPNKFISNVLNQANINFETEKIFDWSNNRKYDFYIPSLNTVIEAHGIQHYEESLRGRKLEQEIVNDAFKKDNAYNNGILNYIEIDCRKSEFTWIKDSILESKLVELIDLSDIDWNKCLELSYRSLLKKACDLWNSGINSTVQIGQILKLARSTIIRYLKKGAKINLCDYNPKDEMKKSAMNNQINNKKSVICIETGVIFPSIHECKQQMNISSATNICAVCNGKRKTANGYTFKYV